MKTILLVLLVFVCQVFAQTTVTRVVDGDTFIISVDERVRIIGIDAPENDDLSTAHLRALIENQEINLVQEGESVDKYGRTLAFVELDDGTDIGLKMVEDGYAFAYLNYPCSRTEEYLSAEIEARTAGRGVWAGHFSTTLRANKDAFDGSTVVYITRTGKKYHREDCQHLSKSSIPISLDEAKERGYIPCSVCSPPQ